MSDNQFPNDDILAEATELPQQYSAAAEAMATAEEDLLARDGVVGVGLSAEDGTGSEEPHVVVLVNSLSDLESNTSGEPLPQSIGGSRVEVMEVGEIVAGELMSADTDTDSPMTLDDLNLVPRPSESSETVDTQALRVRTRPARPGFSVGHPKVTAGTIGAGCYDISAAPGVPRRYYILSNNHVLANSNNARVGDSIIQPGTYDGGRPGPDTIGRLRNWVPIHFGGRPNLVDAAIAEVPFHNIDRDIYWTGYPSIAAAAAKVGMVVQKTGRTTSYTTGKVTVINATVNVGYGKGRVARFVRQILTTRMGAGGDSGSLVLDLNNRPVGLLFAGSSKVTVHNPIAYVQTLLKVRVWP